MAIITKHQPLLLTIAVIVAMLFFQKLTLAQPELLTNMAFSLNDNLEQPWRWVAAHFVHNDWSHAIGNSTALLVIAFLFRRHFSARGLANDIILIAVGTSLLIQLVGTPAHFAGFSAVNHGLLMLALLLEWRQYHYALKEFLITIPLVLVLLKVIAELSQPGLAALHGAGIAMGVLASYLHQRRLAQLTPSKE